MRLGRATAGAAVALVLCSLPSCGGGSHASIASTQTLTRHLDERANGTTVAVHFGDTIVVTLHSTYWKFLPPTGNIVQPVGPPFVQAGSSCPHVAGSGCGTVEMTYNVGRVGAGTLSAHRDSCGEALRCVGNAADWAVKLSAT